MTDYERRGISRTEGALMMATNLVLLFQAKFIDGLPSHRSRREENPTSTLICVNGLSAVILKDDTL